MEDFKLIETVLWEDGSYFLLDRHLKRLEKSAEAFSFECETPSINAALEALGSSFKLENKYKVRLLAERSGEFDIASSLLDEMPDYVAAITLSPKKTDSSSVFLLHKTTKRELYDSEHEKFRKEGFFDVLFTNQKDEVTEGAITNIIVHKGEDYFTPPVSSGVLPGTYREYLLTSQEIPLKEKVLLLEDLLNADEIFVINSVRKTVKASFRS